MTWCVKNTRRGETKKLIICLLKGEEVGGKTWVSQKVLSEGVHKEGVLLLKGGINVM